MFNSPGSRRLVLTALCSLIVLCVAQLSARAQCETATDAKIVGNIYAQIKADKALAAQISHINVQSTNLAVKYQGWVSRKSEYDRVVGFGAKTACVRLVNVNDFSPTPPVTNTTQRLGGCAAGTKQCGDICIPDTDVCSITAYLGFVRIPILFENTYAFAPFSGPACGLN